MNNIIVNDQTQTYSANIILFFETIFPYILGIAFIITNICVIIGAITYLIDEREYQAKQMIFRSIITLTLLTMVFSNDELSFIMNSGFLGEIESLYYFVLMYLLFILAALALILFIASCGLYLIDSNSKYSKYMSKSIICLIMVLVPTGMNFPSFPKIW